MIEFNDMDNNKLKNNVNEKVREAFNRYHQVAQETFQKILTDKENKHQEVINILTTQLIESKTERDNCLNKLGDMSELLDVKTKEIEVKKIEILALKAEKNELIQQNQKIVFERESLEKQLSDLQLKNDELENIIEIIRRDTQESEKILRDEITNLNTMLEESIELAERLLKDKH
ncbi:MAG: hypothetical protein HQK72_16865 [Desulfamplus sp.]|nr:hypothetical protein [Desulfamplus sp.]